MKKIIFQASGHALLPCIPDGGLIGASHFPAANMSKKHEKVRKETQQNIKIFLFINALSKIHAWVMGI